MIEYNTLLEVPVEIREFYEEVTVSERTGEQVSETFTYTEEEGVEQSGSRLVSEYADVLYIKELPTPETKSKADLERVISLSKPSRVIDAFVAMVAAGEQLEWFNEYKDYLVAVQERLELIANYVPELDEDGVEIPLEEPDELVAPTRPVIQDLVAMKAKRDNAAALASFKSSRQVLIDNAVVDANGFQFDADEISIGRMASAILAAIAEEDTFSMSWSLADTSTGVMTDVTLADVKLAHQLAVLNMAAVWGVV